MDGECNSFELSKRSAPMSIESIVIATRLRRSCDFHAWLLDETLVRLYQVDHCLIVIAATGIAMFSNW